MPLALFVAFVAFPALEIYVAVQVAHAIGFGWMLLALVAAGFLGLYVMRRAGASWWRALRGRSGDGTNPDGRAAAASALLFVAGLLLFLPGFVSDALGLLLLLPPVRGLLQAGTAAWFVRRFTSVTGPGGVRLWTRETTVLRGEVVRDDEPREDGSQPPQLPTA
jgi:UPF0716 protein FxsA